ncbi:MAG: response regulator [Verrucomicrobiota bacterium]
MTRAPDDVLPARILIVDDERQIHASVRLRLGSDYEIVSCYDAPEALERLQRDRFDLCLADIHMPRMDGLAFIQEAQRVDPALGYVVLSAFDTEDNLRRTIPLQVFDFIGKPLPEREGFEHRIPEWIARTRQQRRDRQLNEKSRTVAQELATSQLAHEAEIAASETARDALLQTANLLTTIHAHLVTATTLFAPRVKADPTLAHLLRNLDEARKTADAAVSVADGFFNSAYASRDSAPAFVAAGLQHAIDIARRMSRADEANKLVDATAFDPATVARNLSGIEFLLMMVPAIGVALAVTRPHHTVRLEARHLPRLDAALKEPTARQFLWLNRKHAALSQPGVQIVIDTAAPALDRSDFETWLKGEPSPFSSIAARGLVAGLQKSHALLGSALAPAAQAFRLVLVLPV